MCILVKGGVFSFCQKQSLYNSLIVRGGGGDKSPDDKGKVPLSPEVHCGSSEAFIDKELGFRLSDVGVTHVVHFSSK